MARLRLPVLTSTAVVVATVAAVVQYAVPAVVPAWQRDPAGLPPGLWWRLVTPLFVQTLGWYQVLVNLVTLAAVGAVAEQVLGRWRWALLFVGGAVGGQVAAYLWHEPGGGDSIGICGLAAGVVVTLLLGPAPVPRLPAHVVVCYAAALAAWGARGAVGAGFAVAAAVLWLRLAPNAERIALTGVAIVAPLMALRHDLHGAALVAGIMVGAAVRPALRRPDRECSGLRG